MLQELNKFYSPFSGFAIVSWRYFGLSVLHVSIYFKFKQCHVHAHGYLYKYNKLLRIKKFAFFKNLQKLFETSLSNGWNIHSMFAMQDKNFTAQNNVEYTSWKPFEASIEKV